MNPELNSAQRKIHLQKVALFFLELHLERKSLTSFCHFWKFLSVPIWALSILGAHPFFKSNSS